MSNLGPAEVCTVDVARNVLSISDLKAFFDGTSVKSYNPRITHSTSYRLCDLETSGVAYPTCEMSSNIGAGIGFKRKASDPSKCIATQCPTGMGLVDGICKNDSRIGGTEYKVNRAKYAQERWEDWMTIPNYHLGNKYSSNTSNVYNSDNTLKSSIIQKYKPCSNNAVPLYRIDPVDGDAMDDEIDKPDKCISKNQYFYQKYAAADDYCPLANIHRFTQSANDIAASLTTIGGNVAEDHRTPAFRAQYDNNKIKETAQAIVDMNEKIAVPDKVRPLDQYAQYACSALETPERVSFAYNQCSNLSVYTSSSNDSDIQNMFAGKTNITQKTKIMKQSCNALFCSDRSTASGGQAICFKAKDIDNTSVEDPIEDPYDDKYLKEPMKASGFYTTLPRSIYIMLCMIGAPFVLVALYYLHKRSKKWSRWLYRWIINGPITLVGLLYYSIYDRIRGFHPSYTEVIAGDWSNGPLQILETNMQEELEDIRYQISVASKHITTLEAKAKSIEPGKQSGGRGLKRKVRHQRK